MKTTSHFTTFFVPLALAAALGIGCSSSSSDSGTPADTGTPGDSNTPTDTNGTDTLGTDTADAGPPAPPALGEQLDRMGRPAVNTALNHAFDPNESTKQAAKDDWNGNKDPSTWATKYTAEVEKNLGILDALDTICGNQVFADKTKTDATRYATLAGVLADDRLWIKSDATTCSTYLAVEADATALLKNGDCGGRMPGYDPIKQTYSMLALGALSGVTDGVATPDRAKVTSFPYLAAPH